MSYIYTIAQAASADAGITTTAAPATADAGITTTASTVQPENKPQGANKQEEGGWGILPMIIIFFVLMYFLMIRPQKKQQKELQDRQNALQVGDKVVSAGGIYGIVREVKEQTIKMEIAPNTVIKIAKTSIIKTVAKDGSVEGK